MPLSEDEETGPGGGARLPRDHSLSDSHTPRPMQGHEDSRDWVPPRGAFTGDAFASVTEVPAPTEDPRCAASIPALKFHDSVFWFLALFHETIEGRKVSIKVGHFDEVKKDNVRSPFTQTF